jgi:hypothetical protein
LTDLSHGVYSLQLFIKCEKFIKLGGEVYVPAEAAASDAP